MAVVRVRVVLEGNGANWRLTRGLGTYFRHFMTSARARFEDSLWCATCNMNTSVVSFFSPRKKQIPMLVAHFLECCRRIIRLGFDEYQFKDFFVHLNTDCNFDQFLMTTQIDYGVIQEYTVRTSCPIEFSSEHFNEPSFFEENMVSMPYWYVNSISAPVSVAFGTRMISNKKDAISLAEHYGEALRKRILSEKTLSGLTDVKFRISSDNTRILTVVGLVYGNFGVVWGKEPQPLPITDRFVCQELRFVASKCAICLQKLASNQLMTNCHHVYHKTCLTSLWNYNNAKFQCPLCRAEILFLSRTSQTPSTATRPRSISARVKWRRRIQGAK